MKFLPAVMALGLGSILCAENCPAFLGSERNGFSRETLESQSSENQPLETVWKVKMSQGRNAFAAAEGRAYVLGNEEEKDIPWCFDTAPGKMLLGPDWAIEFHATQPTWNWSDIPLIARNYVLSEVEGKDSFGAAMEKTAWKCGEKEKPGYADRRFARHSWEKAHGINTSAPVIRDNRVFLSCGSDFASTLTAPDFKVIRADKKLALSFQNARLPGDHIFAGSGDSRSRADLIRLNLKGETPPWTESSTGNRSNVLQVGKQTLLLTESGEPALFEPDPTEYREITRQTGLARTIWAAPTFSDALLFLRNNESETICPQTQTKAKT